MQSVAKPRWSRTKARRVGSLLLAWSLPCLLALGCAPDVPEQTRPSTEVPAALPDEEVVLRIGELSVTAGEVHAFDDWLNRLDPRIGRETRLKSVLDEFVLPIAAARRAFPELRQVQREAAEALARVVGSGGLAQLRETAAGIPDAADLDRVHPTKMPFPVSNFAFNAENVLAVSPPIEVPRGYWIVSTDEYREGLSSTDDRILVFRVPFMTHSEADFNEWWFQTRQELGQQLEFVHPDYKNALPYWVQQPAN